jgi:hypothetical protein
MQPCVLWMDEIEGWPAAGEGDTGTGTGTAPASACWARC